MIQEIREVISGSYEVSDYPTLLFQASEWSLNKPLKGLRVLDATPVFRNTLCKYIPLLEAGAELTVGISSVMPHDEHIVSFLQQIGINIITPSDNYEFDIILDCAAAFIGLRALIGYSELTRSGVDRYKDCTNPVYVADSSRIKRIETSLGTGEGYFRAMAELGYAEWSDKHLVIFGDGKVSRGLSIYGRKYGAYVDVFDENSPRCEVKRAIESAYAVVTATGVKDALESYSAELIASKSLLANMGVEDEFSCKVPSDRVLAAKKPLNFTLAEPTHLRYIETTMALHNQGAVELLALKNYKGLVLPTECIETKFLKIVEQEGKVDLDVLFDLDSISKGGY